MTHEERNLRIEHEKRVKQQRFDRAGFVKVTCLDDEDSHLQKQFHDKYGHQLTMVARANDAGGILGLLDVGDRKYGEGAPRRWIGDDQEVVRTEENFRPDGGKLPVSGPEPAKSDRMRGCRPCPDDRPLPMGLEDGDPGIHIKKVDEYEEIDVLDVLFAQAEIECYEEVKARLGRDPKKEEFDVRMPKALYDEYRDGYKGYKVLYGVKGEVVLRHRHTSITKQISLPTEI